MNDQMRLCRLQGDTRVCATAREGQILDDQKEVQPVKLDYATSRRPLPTSRLLVRCGPTVCVLAASALLAVRVAAVFHPGGWGALADSGDWPNQTVLSQVIETIALVIALTAIPVGVICVVAIVHAALRKNTVALIANIVSIVGFCIVFFWAVWIAGHLYF